MLSRGDLAIRIEEDIGSYRAKVETVSHSRFQRVLRLIAYLQSGPRYNAGQLAREFQVSRRTVFRDIEFLRETGVPVIFDEENDAYRLPQQYQISPVRSLSDDELATVFVAAHLSLAQTIPELASTVREATAKLVCYLPEELRMQITNLLNACVADLTTAARRPPDCAALNSIFKAIRTKRQVRIRVAVDRSDSLLETKVAPYRIVGMFHDWLLVGRSSVHRGIRSFPVSQIRRVEVTEDAYAVPQGFRLRPVAADRPRITGQMEKPTF